MLFYVLSGFINIICGLRSYLGFSHRYGNTFKRTLIFAFALSICGYRLSIKQRKYRIY